MMKHKTPNPTTEAKSGSNHELSLLAAGDESLFISALTFVGKPEGLGSVGVGKKLADAFADGSGVGVFDGGTEGRTSAGVALALALTVGVGVAEGAALTEAETLGANDGTTLGGSAVAEGNTDGATLEATEGVGVAGGKNTTGGATRKHTPAESLPQDPENKTSPPNKKGSCPFTTKLRGPLGPVKLKGTEKIEPPEFNNTRAP
jgi:hypothetical protein